jgi:hypothetical protein
MDMGGLVRMTLVKTVKFRSALLMIAAVAVAGPAFAHHSFAMFDSSKLATLDGTVKDFRWSNPHSTVAVYGSLTPGAPPTLWTLELTSPSNLLHMGWDKHSVSEGDHVLVQINPLRSGEPGGALKKLTVVATGKVLETHALGAAPLRGDQSKEP